MKTTTIPTVLLALTVAASLSACSVSLKEPVEPTSGTEGTPTPTAAADDTTTTGVFTTGDCDGKDVEVKDDSTAAVLSGQCGVITITASGATVTVQNAESVSVTGTENTVIVEGKVGTVTLGGDTNWFSADDADSVSIPGGSNQVTLNTVGSLDLSGSGNFVAWSAGAASASDSGSGNTVVAP